jgi:hypothetical protein
MKVKVAVPAVRGGTAIEVEVSATEGNLVRIEIPSAGQRTRSASVEVDPDALRAALAHVFPSDQEHSHRQEVEPEAIAFDPPF